MRCHQSNLLLIVAVALRVTNTSSFAFVKSPISLKNHLVQDEVVSSSGILPAAAPTQDLRRRRWWRTALKYHHVSPLQYKVSTEVDHHEQLTKDAKKLSNVGSLLDGYTDTNNGLEASNKNIVLPTAQPLPGDCDVKSYINEHVKFFYDEPTFLVGPTARTQKALAKFNELLTKEREAGGVLSVDTETPSTITSHEPGYLLSKDEDVIVGMQADEPLKRTCKPHGGFGVVKKALESYGYEPGEKLKAFRDDVVTHNDLTFSMYTDQV